MKISSILFSLAGATVVLFSTGPAAQATVAVLTDDSYVDNYTSGSPVPNTTNYGTNANLRVYKNGTRILRTFIKFDLTPLGAGLQASSIQQATLRLFVGTTSNAFGTINVTPVTSAWTEGTIKNSTTGTMTFGPLEAENVSVPAVQVFVTVDLTDLVKDWISGTQANQGICLTAGTSAPANFNVYFDSKEAGSGHEPMLDITLANTGPAGPAGPQGPQGPPEPAARRERPGPAGADRTGHRPHFPTWRFANGSLYQRHPTVSRARGANFPELFLNNIGNPSMCIRPCFLILLLAGQPHWPRPGRPRLVD